MRSVPGKKNCVAITPRHKAAHVKVQHGECITHSLSSTEQLESKFEEDAPDSMIITQPEPSQARQGSSTLTINTKPMTVSSNTSSISISSCTTPSLVKSPHDVAIPYESCTLHRKQQVNPRHRVFDIVSSIIQLGRKGGCVRWSGNGLLLKYTS
jgi:quinolinate synthase